MAHYNTVFSQLLKLLPRHEFETLAKQHHSGRSFRSASRWSQFVTMAMGQLSGQIVYETLLKIYPHKLTVFITWAAPNSRARIYPASMKISPMPSMKRCLKNY